MLSLPDLHNYHEPLALDVTSIQFVAIGFFFYVPITFISFKVLESSAFCLKYLALVFVNLCTSLAMPLLYHCTKSLSMLFSVIFYLFILNQIFFTIMVCFSMFRFCLTFSYYYGTIFTI